MMDDPLISTNLGDFLNQIHVALLLRSAASGMFAPRGSILLTSNEEEVKSCATFNLAVALINATVHCAFNRQLYYSWALKIFLTCITVPIFAQYFYWHMGY